MTSTELTIQVPPAGYPEYYRDPTGYSGPRLGVLALGRFTVNDTYTFVYERYRDERFVQPDQKMFLVIGLGGIEGAFDSSDAALVPFGHDRYQKIIRMTSLRDWWIKYGEVEEAQWLSTTVEGRFIQIVQHEPRDTY